MHYPKPHNMGHHEYNSLIFFRCNINYLLFVLSIILCPFSVQYLFEYDYRDKGYQDNEVGIVHEYVHQDHLQERFHLDVDRVYFSSEEVR